MKDVSDFAGGRTTDTGTDTDTDTDTDAPPTTDADDLADLDELGEVDQGPMSFSEWLMSTPDQSVRDVDPADFFDPEQGAEARIALLAADFIGSGDRLPVVVQFVVGIVELFVKYSDPDSDRDDDQDDDQGEPVVKGVDDAR
jgi:hypothetical protein